MATGSTSATVLDAAQRAWLKKMGVALDAPVRDGTPIKAASDRPVSSGGTAPGKATASTASGSPTTVGGVTTGLEPVRPEPQRKDGPQPKPQPPAPGSRPLLKKGAKGQAVKEMQGLLKKHGATINDDGDFGAKTEAAVKEFQKTKGLKVDGIVGDKTWAALEAASPEPPTPPSPPDTNPRKVVVLVTDADTNDAIDNAAVVVGDQTEPTGNTGQATLSLPPGKHSFGVSAPGFRQAVGIVEVTTDDKQPELRVEMKSDGSAATGDAVVDVVDSRTNKRVRNATIHIDDDPKPISTGDAELSAAVTVSGLKRGKHSCRVTAPNFKELRSTFQINGGDTVSVPMKLVSAGPPTGTGVEVRMQVTDKLGIGMTASFKMTPFPRPFDTDRDGIFTLKKVPPGKHDFHVTTTAGFLANRGSVTITGSESSPVRVDVEMEPVRVVFLVKDEAGNDIRGAIVGIGNLEAKPTDDKGRVELSLLPPGKHKFLVTAKGHEDKTGTVNITSERESNLPPVELRLKPTSAPAPNGKIDFANLKGPFDFSKLHEDLKQSQGEVREAIEAEKAMESTAKSEGVDLNKPEDAAKDMNLKLSDDDKDKLKSALFALRNTRHDMNETFHHMQTNFGLTAVKLKKLRNEVAKKLTELSKEEREKLKAKGVEPIEGFFNGLDHEHEGAGHDIVRLLDMGEKVIETAHNMKEGPVLAIIMGVVGSDYFKELIHAEKDISEKLKQKIDILGRQYNLLVDELATETVEEVLVLQGALVQLNNDYAKKQEDYVEEHAQLAKLIDRLSSGAGSAIPPQFATVHAAVMKAALQSETARSALPAQTKRSVNPRGKEKLPTDKAEFYMIYFHQFNPLGELIFDGTDTGMPGSIGRNVLVFQKDGKQFAYRETKQSLQQLAQQLDPVKQLFDSREKLEALYKKWNKVLFE